MPGWSQYYLDYKFLKKIISSLAANRPASEAAALALGVRPSDVAPKSSSNEAQERDSEDIASILGDGLNQPPLQSTSGQDDDRGPDFQAHKAAFFFKLERELEKVCQRTSSGAFYVLDNFFLDKFVLSSQGSRAKDEARDFTVETESCSYEGPSGIC